MSGAPGYSSWHPRRLPDRPPARQDSFDSQKIFSSRPPTPMFGRDMPTPEGPSGPQIKRITSDSSLLQFSLEAPDVVRPAPRRTLHERARSISQRVPLPQGVSVFVGVCTTVAFILSVTTLSIGMSNRRMLIEATEQRHDPHSALMRMIYTVVYEAVRANLANGTQRPPPPGTILPP